MLLQETCGNAWGNSAFDRLGNDVRLVFTKCNDKDLIRAQNRSYAHRHRTSRHVVFAKKIRGRIRPRNFVQSDQAGRTGLAGARLVETDMTGTPNTKYLNCLLYTSPSPRDQRGSRMPSSA